MEFRSVLFGTRKGTDTEREKMERGETERIKKGKVVGDEVEKREKEGKCMEKV